MLPAATPLGIGTAKYPLNNDVMSEVLQNVDTGSAEFIAKYALPVPEAKPGIANDTVYSCGEILGDGMCPARKDSSCCIAFATFQRVVNIVIRTVFEQTSI